MIFIKTFTRPEIKGKFFTQKQVIWNDGKIATKQPELDQQFVKTSHTMCKLNYSL